MDKIKHFIACFAITLFGSFLGRFAGVYAGALCAFLREYDRWVYTGKFDKSDTIRDLGADFLGITAAIIIVFLGGVL